MDEDIRKKIEAILFSLGRKISVQELSKMIKIKDNGKIVACLIELKKKYNDDPDNSLMILQDGDDWKLTIKDQYIDVAKEIGIETELSKSVMETLAIIAYKNPVIQSDVIKVRTNKAYDHLKELEELGYITREVWGRSKKIRLAPKFFEYFDLPPESLKENFSTVEKLEQAIEEKEHELHSRKQERENLIEEKKRKEIELDNKNIYMEIKVPENYESEKENDSLDPEKVILTEETFHDKNGLDIIKKQKLGDLEVVDEEPTEEELREIEKRKEQEKQLENEKPLEPEITKLGDLEVIDEEPIDEELEESKTEDFNEDIDLEQQENDTPEDEISSIQEAKDLLNQELGENSEQEEDKDFLDEEIDENNIQEINQEDSLDNSEDEAVSQDDNKSEYSETVTPEQLAQAVEDALKKERENNESLEQDEYLEEDDSEEEIKKEDKDISEEDDLSEINFDDDDDEPEEDLPKKTDLKEDKIFEMSGIPKNILEKIEEKSEEILGQTKKKEIKEDIFDD